MTTLSTTIPTSDLVGTTATRSRRPRMLVRATTVLVALATVGIACLATPAGASVNVGGVTFQDSTALCGNGQLSIWVGDNTYAYANAPARWAQIRYYDYSLGVWKYTEWRPLNSLGFLWTVSNFGHRGYIYPYIKYAVQTSTGVVYGDYTFRVFSQSDWTGYMQSPSYYCYI